MRRVISIMLAMSMTICGLGGVWMNDSMSVEIVEAKAKEVAVPEDTVEVDETAKTQNSKATTKKSTKKESKKTNKSNYIVVTKSQNALQKIEGNYESRKTSELQRLLPKENITSVKVTKKTAEKIEDRKDVVLVEKDVVVKACSQRSRNFNRKRVKYYDAAKPEKDMQWNFQSIKLDRTKKPVLSRNKKVIGAKGADISKKVKVAILDSGIDYYNDIEIKESINLIPGEEEMSPLFIDDTGHGTSVAGIIAATENEDGITGINDNVEIYSARILSDDSAPISRVVEGIYWAIEKEVNIINLSFSTPEESQVLQQAIEDAQEAGILIVAAAGNGGSVEYPAAYDGVIAVGSVDAEGVVSENSSTGEELDLVAPGEKILSSSLLGGTLVTSGTSLSAPHVVGAASLLWEKDLAVSGDFIRELLFASANGYGDEESYGEGLIDYEYALKIYDDFKVKYYAEQPAEARVDVAGVDTESLKKADGIEIGENESAIVTFDENTYVEGRWADHDKMAADATNVVNFQKGAKEPDANGDLKKLGTNHAWHGGRFLNYVSIYRYLNKVARAVGDLGESATKKNIRDTIRGVDTVDGLEGGHYDKLPDEALAKYSGGVYNRLKDDLCKDSVVDKLHGKTKRQKEAFVFGMASHVATDVYAHSSFRYEKGAGKWRYIDHVRKKDDSIDVEDAMCADNPKCVKRRHNTAKKVLGNIVDRFMNTRGDVAIRRDFFVGNLTTAPKERVYYNADKIQYTEEHQNTDATYRIYHFANYMAAAGEADYAYYSVFNDVTFRPSNSTK